MKKSTMSKKGSCLSSSCAGLKDEASLDLMRISLKKETDRRQKLEKLLSRYESIRGEQKSHIKTIKSSIIQLKDVPTIPKIHFLVDPNIYVDNNLSIETREFLCMLLNTFYKRYQENSQYQARTEQLAENIRKIIKKISFNEELLFKIQKLNINHQVQLEGQLLSEKNKLREENSKIKYLKNQQSRVLTIWNEHKGKFDEQKAKVDEFIRIVNDLEHKIIGLTEKITQGEQIRQDNQQKISGEMAYQMKFEQQVNLLKQSITKELNRQKCLKKKIMEKKLKIDKMKGYCNYDNNKHNVNLKLLQLSKPRPSTKVYGVGIILDLENTFAKTLSTWNHHQ